MNNYMMRCRMFAVSFILVSLSLLVLLTSCTGVERRAASSAETPTPTTDKVIGPFNLIPDTDYLRAPILGIGDSSRYSFSGSDSSVSTTHNFLFVNRRDETIQKLLPTNESIIIFDVGLPEPYQQPVDTTSVTDTAEVVPIEWFLYTIVTKDTNGDEQLTGEDLQILAISDVGGTAYTVVITDVEILYQHTLRDEQTLLVIYRQNGKPLLTSIDLPTRAILKTTEFPPLGEDVW